MSLAVVYSRALCGAQAPAVRVETYLAGGLPAFHIVGLADTEVRESRERVRAAIQCIGLAFPAGRIVVNLAPADLPKESGRFDLPIALGVLLASGQIALPELLGRQSEGATTALAHLVFAGELSLSGTLVPVDAPLSIALGVRADLPGATLILPWESAHKAAGVPDITVLAARSLDDVIAHLEGHRRLEPSVPESDDRTILPLCLSDVRGQLAGHQALCLAAAGGHSLLMRGWPGVGKSMLAQRLPGILPPLRALDALEVSSRYERVGLLPPPVGQRPFRSPHHSASMAAMVGGGARPMPGEITLAHHGVLFLDELPEFGRATLEALREPLETGWVAISRVSAKVRYPAGCLLIAAMNPCPCGWFGHPRRRCPCQPEQVARYRARLSGPLLDRIDLQVDLGVAGSDWMDAPKTETSISVRSRVQACQDRQYARQGCLNAHLDPDKLAGDEALEPDARLLLREVIRQGEWSARAGQRVLRVARTLADLHARDAVSIADVAQATHFRQDMSPSG